VIGFTATPSSKAIKGLERSVFETMKFHEATYWPKNEAVPFVDYSLRAVDVSCFRDLCRVVSHMLDVNPVLLYCNKEDV